MQKDVVSERKIRVLFVIGAMSLGGSERQLLGILQHLDRSQFEPYLFTFYSHGELVSQVPADVIQHCDQTAAAIQQATRNWLPGQLHARLVQRLKAYCKAQKIDVVYDRTFHVSLVSGQACYEAGLPYFSTSVTNPQTGFFSTAGRFAWIKYWRLRKVYRHAVQVLCVSEGLRAANAEFFRLPLDRFATCYNFLDQHRIDAIESAARDRLPFATPGANQIGTAQRPLRLVTVGRLHSQKGMQILLPAIAELVHHHRLHLSLDVLGDGPQRNELIQQVQVLGIKKQIHFKGMVDNPAPFVARADVYCLPSLVEGMPNSLVEAMWLGTPAMASNCAHGPAEITLDGALASLIPVGNIQLWVQEILLFVADPEAFQKKAIAAQASVKDRFSPETGIQVLQRWLSRPAKFQSK